MADLNVTKGHLFQSDEKSINILIRTDRAQEKYCQLVYPVSNKVLAKALKALADELDNEDLNAHNSPSA